MVEKRAFVAQVVDDDPAIVRFIRRNLEMQDFHVVVSSDGKSALDQFEDEKPNLVILDVGLPEIDGLEVCSHLRATSDVPIIMVTSRSGDSDVITGLEAGADDYLGKPFSAGVLLARVDAVLRRRFPRFDLAPDRFERDGLIVDLTDRKTSLNGTIVHLTPIEFRLMATLIQHKDKVVTSAQILTEVWGSEYFNELQILRTHIGRLRRKVEHDAGNPTFIMTEPGVGYWLRC
jgi:two-component system KDP operon response regulator KdpE